MKCKLSVQCQGPSVLIQVLRENPSSKVKIDLSKSTCASARYEWSRGPFDESNADQRAHSSLIIVMTITLCSNTIHLKIEASTALLVPSLSLIPASGEFPKCYTEKHKDFRSAGIMISNPFDIP